VICPETCPSFGLAVTSEPRLALKTRNALLVSTAVIVAAVDEEELLIVAEPDCTVLSVAACARKAGTVAINSESRKYRKYLTAKMHLDIVMLHADSSSFPADT
jgi:hypothetical protein